ncbi:hypothetical protein LJC58_08910 [Lachnospiraceae bacterium OttesenSCG-928-D06]|nr:hypothetical protein [Lachnospiraceae bacterium OttesenSCG-928-D06]
MRGHSFPPEGSGYINVAGDPPSVYLADYIDFIKSYETHAKDSNGKFILDNNGDTIGYGHDLSDSEKQSEIYANGISETKALEILKSDLDDCHGKIKKLVNTLNTNYGDSLNIIQFSREEYSLLLDVSFNRGFGLYKRPQLESNGKPYSSLPILLIAVAKKDEITLIQTLKEETYNTKGIYYSGLELRRMDQYEIYKHGDYNRDRDINRGYQ